MDARQLTLAVKAAARRLGFALVGVTTPDPPPHLEVYARWLAQGRHAEMAYLAAPRAVERRGDPRLILPECRSILVLGIRYPKPAEEPPAPTHGRVAAYAGGTDYHEVLPERLQALVAFIEAQVGAAVPNRWYTDTGPLLERELAQRAGLGWIGKNTCLINPQQGSYFLLAEILLGVDLVPDAPLATDHCGTCRRCIEACPTGCILPDRTLDSARCLSYLTIELKGELPADLRPGVGEWVFGCDICQAVCPWNLRFATDEYDPAFAPQVTHLDLVETLSLTAEQFNRRFKHSPIRRAKRAGLLRNAAVSLGARKILPAQAALVQAAGQDPSDLVRTHAAWALGQLDSQPPPEA